MKTFLFKKWLIRCAILGIGVVLAAFIAHRVIAKSVRKQLFTDVNKVPFCKTALLLGTNPKSRSGKLNLFFKFRMDAIAQLYKAGKIKYVIVSGDNSHSEYNETDEMRAYLVALGIPDSVIYSDFAGFRTLDSVVRCKEVFGQDSIMIVSQLFHNERAVYLANKFNIQAIGFNAKTPMVRYSVKTHIREYFARLKVFVDLLFGVKPKFLGEKIKIG
jgi:SanA protein